MHRYSSGLCDAWTRLLRLFFPRFVSRLLVPKRWNCQWIIIYFVLISFALVLLIHEQFNNFIVLVPPLNFSGKENEAIQCRFPQLSLYSADLQFATKKDTQLVCQSQFQTIVIENHRLRLVLPRMRCTAVFLVGEGDQTHRRVSVALTFNRSTPLLSDYFTLECGDPMRKAFSHKVPYASVHFNERVHQRLASVKKKENDYNVLVVGLDSVSKLQFERMLPKTFEYITEDLDGIILKGAMCTIDDERNGSLPHNNEKTPIVISMLLTQVKCYNILGDGTPQQLIPMLTGFAEPELPTTLRRYRNSSFVDIYPFVWNEYRQQGFVTGYAEDRTEYGIFTLRLKGFRQTPTDHYLLPFYRMPATRSLISKASNHCIGNQTSIDVFLSYIEQFWSSYRAHKKFYFGFFKQYTHDGYYASSTLDVALFHFLQRLKQTNEHEKTIIIVMTDHGARFSAIRRTPQGKLEERLPFMSFSLPKSFRAKYPEAVDNLRKNVHRLTTPYDIHATLQSLLHMDRIDYGEEQPLGQRNISLFRLIPAQRTCDDLHLEPHWCSCLQWHTIAIDHSKVQQAIEHIVKSINAQLDTVENKLCQRLELLSIHSAQMYQPNQALLRFSKTSDIDGRVPKYDDKKNEITFYQITFETSPNTAVYEATTQYSTKSNAFTTDLNHISRLNAYKSSAACIETTYSHLRKFCQCIE